MSIPLMLGAEIAKYGMKKHNQAKKPSFKSSEMGKYYANKKTQGIYGSQNVQNMANQYGKYLNRGVDDKVSNVKGQLINKGMDNSIAGISTINKYKDNADNKIADYYNKVYQKNEDSKDGYAEKYASGVYNDQLQTFRENQAINNEAMDSLSSKISPMITKNIDDKNFQNLLQGVKDDKISVDVIIKELSDQGYSEEQINNYLNGTSDSAETPIATSSTSPRSGFKLNTPKLNLNYPT